MKQPLLIYGAGGLGREILSIVRTSDLWEPVAFIDDVVPADSVVKGLKVIGGMRVLEAVDGPRHVVVAIGNPGLKRRLVRDLATYAIRYPAIVHPTAILQDPESIRIGAGCVVAAGCILTTDIYIGDHVLININTTIGHDVSIGAHTSIMCGVNISGEASIGASVMIGSGSNLLNRVRIGDRSVVGMGAVVIRDVDPDVTVAGVPAKTIRV